MDVTWDQIRIRSVVGVFGIRKDGDHWRCFDDNGDYPGEFYDAEAARSGCWVAAADAARINDDEHRLIIMDDVRACMRAARAAMDAARNFPPPGFVVVDNGGGRSRSWYGSGLWSIPTATSRNTTPSMIHRARRFAGLLGLMGFPWSDGRILVGD